MTFRQKTRISEEDVKLEGREMNCFIASKRFMAQDNAPRVTRRKNIIMHNCYAKK
jgi:hypothetical protein